MQKMIFISLFCFFHFLFIYPAFSMNDELSDTFLLYKSKTNIADQARQAPRRFAYLDDNELIHSGLAHKRLYIKLLKSAEDIREEDNIQRKYTLVPLKKVIKIFEKDREKFDENFKLVLENIDEEGMKTIQNPLSQINPFAIEYIVHGEDDPFALFLETQRILYKMQLDMIFSGMLDVSEEEHVSYIQGSDKYINEKNDEEFAFELQLDELCNDMSSARFSNFPIINSAMNIQIDSDAVYARMLHEQLNGTE